MTRTSTTTATLPTGRSSAHSRSPITPRDLAGFHSRPGHSHNASSYAGNNGWGYGGMTYQGWGYGG